MTTNRVSRAERVLDNAVAFGTITETGRDFLFASLDPFHDKQLKNLAGWPDLETSASVVRCVKQTISVASSVAGEWDAHIDLWPWLNSTQFNGSSSRANNSIEYTYTTTNALLLGGLTVHRTPAGTSANYADPTSRIGSITLPDSILKGAHRVVGLGFEVVNTTADIYKQGQALVYRQSNGSMKPTNFNITKNGPVITKFQADGVLIALPPQNAAQLMLIPGSRQWAAREGVYAVACFVGQDNPPTMVDYTIPVLYQSTLDSDTAYNSGTGLATYNTAPLLLASTTDVGAIVPSSHLLPIHTSGCKLTGLSTQTSLSITLNVYVETFPTIAESDILVLATPSAQYDPVALEMFSKAIGTSPVAVPVGENPLGEWFANVVANVADFVTPIAKTLGFDNVSKLSSAISSYAKGKQMQPKKKTKQKPRNTRQLIGPSLPPRPDNTRMIAPPSSRKAQNRNAQRRRLKQD